MKNLNSKLFEKSFDLKNTNLFGGRVATYKECSSTTNSSSCSDVSYQTSDDNGNVLSTCTDYDCK